MSALFGQRVTVPQERGPDVDLHVWGDEFYARHETPDGYAVIEDPALGLYSYARLEDGRYVSTGVPISQPPPPDLPKHLEESRTVRAAKAAHKRQRLDG